MPDAPSAGAASVAERVLVIETATAACSVALVEGGSVIARAHDVVGRGHAERLVPMIASLPGGGRAARVLVDCGPGSFTGVRVGLAAARALGLGWGIPVAGFSSLAILAAAALARTGTGELVAVLEGGHGEVFMQAFAHPTHAISALSSLTPDAALIASAGRRAVGSGLDRLRAADPDFRGEDALPDAADVVLLPPDLVALPPRPIYGRAPDAKLPAARPPVPAGR